MGIIIRWLCWPSVSVSAVMAPASGELQDTAVREAFVLVWHISKHRNKTNPIPMITSQSSLSQVLYSTSEGHARLTTGIFLSRPYCQLLFLALPSSALCLHKIATFITHLPSHERWQPHICFHLRHFQGMDQSIVSERQLRFVYWKWTASWLGLMIELVIVLLRVLSNF